MDTVTLNKKQQLFVDYYLQSFNATDAARRAGYGSKALNVASVRTQGYLLVHNEEIKKEIQERLDEVHMSADEALKLLANIARGDLGDFITVEKNGNIFLDLSAKEKTKLIKRIKHKKVVYSGKNYDTETYTEDIELYSALDALEKVLRVHGKFTEKMDITSNGETIVKVDDEQFDRAISTLADALRESLSGTGAKSSSKVDTTK